MFVDCATAQTPATPGSGNRRPGKSAAAATRASRTGGCSGDGGLRRSGQWRAGGWNRGRGRNDRIHRTCFTAPRRSVPRSVPMTAPRILVVRLGAMGDVVAALPAVASLKHSIPHSKITWVIEPKWSALLEGNPYIDSVIRLDRRTFTGLRRRLARAARRTIRFGGGLSRPDQIGSGGHGRAARAHFRIQRDLRARVAGLLVLFDQSAHPLVSCRGAQSGSGGGGRGHPTFCTLFRCRPESRKVTLPEGPFVLASPLAGWGAKQWPLDILCAARRATAAGMRPAPGDQRSVSGSD